MSGGWKAWADSALFNAQNTKRCADNSGIYGLDGNPWAQSENFNVSSKEVLEIITSVTGTQKTSVFVGGVKYIVLNQIPDELLRGKAGEKGLTALKGKTYVLISQYNNSSVISPGNNCDRAYQVKHLLDLSGY